jgi:subtilisin family serine protease
MLLGAVVIVATGAAACLPPPPPPPPPPAICGVTATAAATATAGGGSSATDSTGAPSGGTEYVAVVQQHGRSKVLTRTVSSAADIAQFRADAAAQGEVTAFEEDGEVHALGETATWGFLDSGFTSAWGVGATTTGTGIRVAEIDTGIDTTHPDLVGHFGDPSDPTSGADIVVAVDKSNPPVDTTDPSSSGHGTHVAGIVAATTGNSIGVEGGAPGVTLVPVRVLGSSGSGSYSDVAAGILWAADVAKGNATVLTMSLGGSSTSKVVSDAIAAVEDPANPNYTHPVITVAAGNSKCSTPLFPASLASTTPQMLSVSALCKVGTTSSCPTDTPWSADLPYKLATYSSEAWSGTGSPTGIAAPGTQIYSTLPGNSYGTLSGTSMATPFVAAAAALVQQSCPADTAQQVVKRLENSAHDLGRPGVDTLYGYGKLDAAAAVSAC